MQMSSRHEIHVKKGKLQLGTLFQQIFSSYRKERIKIRKQLRKVLVSMESAMYDVLGELFTC